MRPILLFFTLIIASTLYQCGLKECKTLSNRPNIILLMADDLGYGDLADYGNPIIKTPHLDDMAKSGILFTRFYAASPVCSPTRGSCLTGRHPYRYNMKWAGRYALPNEELTIAEYLKENGYATGHYGKWHVGGLSETINQSEFPGGPTPYSPPWKNGFDQCFSTESMMPTYNPYYHVGGDYGTKEYKYVQSTPVALGQKTGGFDWGDRYWNSAGGIVNELLAGDDSEIIMDRSLTFIREQVEKNKPFLALIWFHAPHTPVVAGNEQRAIYDTLSIEEQHWYGSISAMDKQIGRLRNSLKDLEIDNNTIVWFCSDNGPSYIHNYNSSGGLRGKKAELFEGGIRVPAILEWPDKFPTGHVSNYPSSTSDILPTILEACSIKPVQDLPLEGHDILPFILNNLTKRYLFFQSPLPKRLIKNKSSDEEQFAVINMDFKLISTDNGVNFQLYNLANDPTESVDISETNLEIKREMKNALHAWRASCARSAQGLDYK